MSAYRIMVVTEEPALRSMLTSLLQESGVQAFSAVDSFDALRQIYFVAPHVIFSDTELGACAGFELLPFLRNRFPEIGVLALLRKRTIASGNADKVVADGFVTVDPLDLGRLAEALAGVLAKCRLRQEGMPVYAAPASEVETIRQSNPPVSICSTCTELEQKASRARMNALLTTAWLRLHPDDSEAVRQAHDADVALQQALSNRQEHGRRAHRQMSARSQTAPHDAADLAPRYATG